MPTLEELRAKLRERPRPKTRAQLNKEAWTRAALADPNASLEEWATGWEPTEDPKAKVFIAVPSFAEMEAIPKVKRRGCVVRVEEEDKLYRWSPAGERWVEAPPEAPRTDDKEWQWWFASGDRWAFDCGGNVCTLTDKAVRGCELGRTVGPRTVALSEAILNNLGWRRGSDDESKVLALAAHFTNREDGQTAGYIDA